MDMLKLSGRLLAVANYVNTGASVIDIGTDHGHIPVYLAQNNIAGRICAADINRNPLDAARAAAVEKGEEGRIEFIQTDGLSGIEPGRFDTVIMAGMGGELIAGIIGAARWTRENGVRLILQPQTKLGYLCRFLSEGGFEVVDAALVSDSGRLYIVLVAQGARAGSAFRDTDVFRLLLARRDPLLGEYLGVLVTRERAAIDGMSASPAACAERRRRQSYVNELLKIRGDCQWRR